MAMAQSWDVSPVGPWTTLPPDAACPTVTSVGSVCSTCLRPDCALITTITNHCDCPSAVPTVTVNFPCGSGCAGIGCYTYYRSASPTPACQAAAPHAIKPRDAVDAGAGGKPSERPTKTTSMVVITPTPSANCSTMVTVDKFPETCGCKSEFCIYDNLVTLPCGCSTLKVATSTKTLACPPAGSTCQYCFTAFPFTKTLPCVSATATPTST